MKTDWYDYGARFYDPALGRWHVQDPLAEGYISLSPYHMSGNNPVNMMDVDGRYYMNSYGKGAPSGSVDTYVYDMEGFVSGLQTEFPNTTINVDGSTYMPNTGGPKKNGANAESKPDLLGTTLSVTGCALVEIGEGSGRYATILITSNGTAVAVEGASAYKRFYATGKYKTPALKPLAKEIAKHADELGIGGRVVGYGGTIIAGYTIGRDIFRWKSGQISTETFTVKVTQTGLAEIIGLSIGGLSGAVIGATTGMHLYLGYRGMKVFHEKLWQWMNSNLNPVNWNSFYNQGL